MEKVVKKIKMPLSENVLTAMKILKKHGFEAYVVGGCVRDFLMGKEPHDFDMTTNALPEEIMAAFDGYTLITAGIKHGTVAVMINKEKIEITTYRIDGEYTDNRHPEKVTFSACLRDDTLRRDFTMNALAYSEEEGIVDYNGGIADVNNKLVRAVGEPIKRFEEDALRIMRAIRFSCVLGFEIEENTAREAQECSKLLKNISAERICEEMDKFLSGIRAGDCLNKFQSVFCEIVPDLFPLSESKINALNAQYVNSVVSYAILFRGIEIETVAKICRFLKFSNERKNKVLAILSCDAIPETNVEAKSLLQSLGPETIKDFIAYNSAYGFDMEKIEKYVEQILENGECYSLKQLAINGRDLLSLGISDGARIGNILSCVLLKVVCEELENDKEILINYVRNSLILE